MTDQKCICGGWPGDLEGLRRECPVHGEVANHAARTREIEARLAGWYTDGEATDLRYLLDRVRALEKAATISWRVYDRFGIWQCGHCGAYGDRDDNADHAPDCIVLTLSAPVEAQG